MRIKLFNAKGIELGTPAETTITIIDNDHISSTIPLSLGQGMGVDNDGTLYDAMRLN
ncbi:MAG: hypothetical protein QM487_14690 [Candidatus Marithrix sp.]